MGEIILFCIVFLSQVLLISWFYPRRVISRARYVLRNFPASTHPKAYPQSPGHYERWLRNVARANLAVVVAGLVIIALILGSLVGGWDTGIFAPSRKHNWAEFIVAPFFLVQLLAGVGFINVSAGKLLQAMTKAPAPRVRTAQLHRRRVVDFVPPTALVVAALTNIAFVAFVLYAYLYLELPWIKMVVSIASVVFTILVFSLTVGFTLNSRKIDPYQAHQDRHRMIKVVVQQAVTYCIAFPVLFAILLSIKSFVPAFVPVMVSLFTQGIALSLLWGSYSFRVEQIDFDVYRQDAGDPPPA